MPSRLLTSFSSRLVGHTQPAVHLAREHDELIATSARYSYIDVTSREFMAKIFRLSPDFDTEFVYNDSAPGAVDLRV